MSEQVTVSRIDGNLDELRRNVTRARRSAWAWDGKRNVRVRAVTEPVYERSPDGRWRADWEAVRG